MTMTTRDALKICEAVNFLSETFGESFQDTCSRLIYFNDQRMAVMKEAVALNNAFAEAPIVERGRMLGITITQSSGTHMSEAVLSERSHD